MRAHVCVCAVTHNNQIEKFVLIIFNNDAPAVQRLAALWHNYPELRRRYLWLFVLLPESLLILWLRLSIKLYKKHLILSCEPGS